MAVVIVLSLVTPRQNTTSGCGSFVSRARAIAELERLRSVSCQNQNYIKGASPLKQACAIIAVRCLITRGGGDDSQTDGSRRRQGTGISTRFRGFCLVHCLMQQSRCLFVAQNGLGRSEELLLGVGRGDVNLPPIYVVRRYARVEHRGEKGSCCSSYKLSPFTAVCILPERSLFGWR